MNELYTQEAEKQFYELMDKKRKEIESLNIPVENKDKLYQLVNKTIESHKETKINYLKSQKACEGIGKNFMKIQKIGCKIKNGLEEIAEKTDKSVELAGLIKKTFTTKIKEYEDALERLEIEKALKEVPKQIH